MSEETRTVSVAIGKAARFVDEEITDNASQHKKRRTPRQSRVDDTVLFEIDQQQAKIEATQVTIVQKQELKVEDQGANLKFNFTAIESGILRRPVTPSNQNVSPNSSLLGSPTFNFSQMQKEIIEITTQTRTPANIGPLTPPGSPDKRLLLRQETARSLKQIPLNAFILYKILPLNTFDHLIENSKNCVSLTVTKKRCQGTLWKPMNDLPDLLESVATLDVRENWHLVYPKLLAIVEMSLCLAVHGRKAVEELIALDYRMAECSCRGDEKKPHSSYCPILALVEPWIWALCVNSDTKVPKLREILSQRATAKENNIDDSNLATKSPSPQPSSEPERIQYLHTFMPFQPYEYKYFSVQQAIKITLEKPLTTPELDSKYLYIYWCPGNFGYVKIGVADDVSKRLRDWEEKCKQEIKEHLPLNNKERILVKHAYRVEKLVHTELKALRFEEKGCKGCGGRHIEWFRTSSDHAAKVIKKYSDWIATSPYQFRENEWRLVKSDSSIKMEEPVEMSTSTPGTESLVKSRRRIPGRHSLGSSRRNSDSPRQSISSTGRRSLG